MRLLVFLFLIVIAFVGYLAYLNPGNLILHLTRDSSIEIPTSALVLLSMAFGGLVVILVAGFVETKHLFVTWRLTRNKKREERVSELLHQGLNAKASLKFSEAAGFFQKILQLDPNHIPTLLLLGNQYRLQGNFLEALRLHRKAKGLDEKNIEVLLSLSEDLEGAHRTEEAIQVLEEILKFDGKSFSAQIRLRDLFVHLGRWENAHSIQEKILEGALSVEEAKTQQNWLVGIKYELGQRLIKQEQTDRAKRYFRGIIKLKKNFIPAYIGLGEGLMAEGKSKETGELWEKAYEMTSSIILLHYLEDLYLSMGEPARILQVYQLAIQRDPGNTTLQFYLGKLYYRLEMVEEAFEVLSGIEPTENRMPDLHKIMGNLYLRKGELSEAAEEFKKALDLKKRVLVPYYCPSCDFHSTQWAGRCPRCGKWNTFKASPIMGDRTTDRATIKSRP
jgi:lipopolysaccharide biosynthesis regulator YciM